MPPAKKLKSGGTSKGTKTSVRLPVAAGAEGESGFAQLAQKLWLKGTKRASSKVKVKNDVLKGEIWDVLEKGRFAFKSLLELESLQILESYLWPGFTDDASDQHVLLLVLVVNIKKREHLDSWAAFGERPDEFSSFFRRVLTLSLDGELSLVLRTHILSFIIHAFQCLDSAIVRKECAPLVSIGTWHNIAHDARREQLLEQTNHLKKVWRASARRYDAADDATKAHLRFDRAWLYSLILDFISVLYDEEGKEDTMRYCERFLELLCDLQSQLPTRRYVNALLQDLHVLPALLISPMFYNEDSGLFRDQCALFAHYTYFHVDDQTGAQLSETEAYDRHSAKLAGLQRVALKHFPEKLTVLALSNYGAIGNRDELGNLLTALTDVEVADLAGRLHLRVTYPASCRLRIDRRFLVEALLCTFERRKTLPETTRELVVMPTEQTLFDQSLARTEGYDGSRPLALPKLNLQFLSVGDFLWRSLLLYRSEAFYGIQQDIVTAIERLKPSVGNAGETIFTGTTRMALPAQNLSVIHVVPPLVGEEKPSLVKAELSVDFRNVRENVRREWESLRPDDTVFLLTVKARQPSSFSARGSSASGAEKYGIVTIRTAEVLTRPEYVNNRNNENKNNSSNNNNNNNNSSNNNNNNQYGRGGGFRRSFVRKMLLKLDPVAFVEDTNNEEASGSSDVYESINLIVRRSARENNFKSVLESIKDLALSDVPIAPWLHEVFLGYGDPAGATYRHLPNRVKKIDYRDTFLDWHHLIESLPGKTVDPGDDVTGSFGPPYVLGLVDKPAEADRPPVKPPSKKRRRDAEPVPTADVETVRVSTYKPPNNGPYPTDTAKRNGVRFTPAQTEAIMSGTQPGLTVIVGPPGTGKTDVATQIINNIYHNFPEQRTLLIAHSNQALNQLFAKIVALDIDERHLLRLGHGEEELDVDGSFSKYGRVEQFLENRNQYLAEVTRLAASLGAPGAHGNSAETAGYFQSVYVEPAWAKFDQTATSAMASAADIVAAFPFHAYFANAPQPLFPVVGDEAREAEEVKEAREGKETKQRKQTKQTKKAKKETEKDEEDRKQVLEIAEGCRRHLRRIFSELADALPFEILRRDREKANYLLTKEARIVAMTSTHAAMRRGEIARLGFHYDSVVVEEAAQITEIESFIPLAMQQPKHGEVALKRVVLCGDHLQNSPIVQNLAFRHYANLEQSLFSRLVRLGVPTIHLDQQGRARSSLADLYRWRYPGLADLPTVQTTTGGGGGGGGARDDRVGAPEFQTANAGFRYDYQFIHVPDFKGRGEAEPSPHFIQNLGEAEYAVAIFQYMRLLGYPAHTISILATYAGQRALIRDVLDFRCRRNPIFGLPKAVTTVDKYQGEQNDYIILSLTRTSRVGYLRDIRRLTVALSRARLGLYVLGRREVFEACYELREAFELLLKRPDKLTLVTGELWPSTRPATEEVGGKKKKKGSGGEGEGTAVSEAVMEGVEHLGQYVYEMTLTKVKQLQAKAGSGEGGEDGNEGDGGDAEQLLEAIREENEGMVALPVEEEEDGEGEDENNDVDENGDENENEDEDEEKVGEAGEEGEEKDEEEAEPKEGAEEAQ